MESVIVRGQGEDLSQRSVSQGSSWSENRLNFKIFLQVVFLVWCDDDTGKVVTVENGCYHPAMVGTTTVLANTEYYS